MRAVLFAFLILPVVGCASMQEYLALPETKAAFDAMAGKAAADAAEAVAGRMQITDGAVIGEMQAAAQNAARGAVDGAAKAIALKGDELKRQLADTGAAILGQIATISSVAGDATGNPIPKLLAMLLGLGATALGAGEVRRRVTGQPDTA